MMHLILENNFILLQVAQLKQLFICATYNNKFFK